MFSRQAPAPTRTYEDVPQEPAKTPALIAAESELEALLVERDQYEEMRTVAIENADVEALLRVDARRTVLPSLVDAAEVATRNARIAWMSEHWMPLFDGPIQQHGEAIAALIEQRQQIDEELTRRDLVRIELDGRRDSVRRELRANEVRRDELVAKSPAARRGLKRLFAA